MSFKFCHFETILKISQGHCGPLTPFPQFRHLLPQSRQVYWVTFLNCISDGTVNQISPARFLAYLQKAAMYVVQVSLLLLSHWFLKISFNICKFAFLSQLLHQASTVKRLFEQVKQIRAAHGPLKLLGEGAGRAAGGREGAVQLEAGERSWFVWLVVYMLLSCWQSLSLWSTSRKELLRRNCTSVNNAASHLLNLELSIGICSHIHRRNLTIVFNATTNSIRYIPIIIMQISYIPQWKHLEN